MRLAASLALIAPLAPRTLAALTCLLLVVAPHDAHAGSSARVVLTRRSLCDLSESLPRGLAERGVVVDASSAEATVEVDIGPVDAGLSASFVVRRGDRESSRMLTARTCDDVLDVLVFAIALALDGAVPEGEPTPAPVSPPPAAVAPPPAPREIPQQAAPARPPPAALQVSFGGKLGASLGASPDVAGRVTLHVELGSSRVNGLSPLVGVGVVAVFPDSSFAASSDVDVASQYVEGDGCLLRFGGEVLGVRPCARLEIGRLQARSRGFSGARLDDGAWAAAGPGLRARLLLGARIFLEAESVVVFPFFRNTFFVNGSEVFTMSAAVGRVGFGGGVLFP